VYLIDMLKTRIILIVVSAVVIWLLFLLPKVVVDNDGAITAGRGDSAITAAESHPATPPNVLSRIREFRRQWTESAGNEKNAIFADSLADLYSKAGKPDSAGWFAGEAARFFKTEESIVRAGDLYYEAYTLALDPARQQQFAVQARAYYQQVLGSQPENLEVKTKMAMTFLSSQSPMQGITMLREVLEADPNNELALFNLGMLSIQSRQFELAVDRLSTLVRINPNHTQGHLLLGIALMNVGDVPGARAQFEKVKEIDKDPAVQATVDSYLKELK
jgi:tetratricopeptide (TPR) repeat protein